MAWFGGSCTQPASDSIRSLAVLPFVNTMNDPAQDYFVEGLQETLITNLARLDSVRVISRTSAMRYKGQAVPLKQIARELNVDALVEGSVLRAGDRVRVTAKLIRGDTEELAWANDFDRDLRDVLELLSDVSRSIASQIEAAVTDERTAGAIRPDAYEAYLRGRHAFNTFSAEGFLAARTQFERAIELDPSFAQAGLPTATDRPKTNGLWAELLQRSFGFDVLACPRCGGRLDLIALIEDPSVIRRILSHLGLPTEVPAARPARPPPLPIGRPDTGYDDVVVVP